ncbi:unnamed protein product [Camellia sinensis]
MSALTPIILYKPTSTTRTTTISYAFLLLPSLKSLKIVSNPEFPSSRLLFSGEFVSRKPVLGCKRARNRSRPNTMTGSISSSGYRGSSSDEGVRVLQQDSSIHGSSEFPPNFTVVRLESTLNRLSKWIVTALFGAIFLWRHDAEALWAAMGSVANVGLSTVLKQLLNQERPVSNLRSDPGMPSSHAQSIFFTFMVENLGINELTIALSVLTLAFGAYLVMATSFTTTPYDQPSGGGWCLGINFLHFVVLVMECDCAEGVYILFVGSNHCCFGGHWILPGISYIHNSVLG